MGSTSLAAIAAALLAAASPGLQGTRAAFLGSLPLPQARAELDAGARAVNNFEDDRAFQIFTRLLAEGPPSGIAAKAHVYLGMIDFNRLDIDRAREEFRRAVTIDPSMEPPLTMSPKARLAFDEARRSVTAEYAKSFSPGSPASAAGGPSRSSSPAPEAAVSESEEGRHVPAGAWWLGGGGLAVGVVGTILFAVAESTLGSDQKVALADGAVQHSLSYPTINTATTEGNAGEVLWAVGGALLVTGIIVALTGGSK